MFVDARLRARLIGSGVNARRFHTSHSPKHCTFFFCKCMIFLTCFSSLFIFLDSLPPFSFFFFSFFIINAGWF